MAVAYRFNSFERVPAHATAGRGPNGRKLNARDWTGVTVGELTAVEPGYNPHWWCECKLGHRVLINSQATLRKAQEAGRWLECPECKKERKR